jgi:Secretion system C-terminal sorting domain
MKQITMLVLSLFIWQGTQAQKEVKKEIKTEVTVGDTPGKKKIRIEKNVNGKREIIEREIEISDDVEEIMLRADSTVGQDNDGEVSVIIKKDKNQGFDWEEEPAEGGKRMKIYTQRRREGDRDFEFDMERLHDKMAQFPERMKTMKTFEWDNYFLGKEGKATIQSLEVFPNRPETDILNLRFYVPNQGDVNITVLDLKGNVIAKSETKNFKGEYVGQLKLKKEAKGVYFVIVAQGEDGMSRKVKID